MSWFVRFQLYLIRFAHFLNGKKILNSMIQIKLFKFQL